MLPPAGQLRDDDALGVAHHLRFDVLVAILELGDGGYVQPSLVRERALSHVRLIVASGHVRQLCGEAVDLGEAAKLLVVDHVYPQFELEVGYDGKQVGVAAALAVAVDGALYLRRAGLHRCDRVGDGHVGVVMAVDADAASDRRADLVDDVEDVPQAACRHWYRRARRTPRRPLLPRVCIGAKYSGFAE